MSQELAKRCIWLNRVYTPSPKTPDSVGPGEKELERRLLNLQRDLRVTILRLHADLSLICDYFRISLPKNILLGYLLSTMTAD